MPTIPTPDAPLSPHWAFVVQVREGSAMTPEALRGRVEHIVSGQAALFTSLEELRAFMEHVLSQGKHTNGTEGHHACAGATARLGSRERQP